jgi:hypothetical protein
MREKRKVPAWAGIPQSLEVVGREQWRFWVWDVLAIGATVPFLIVVGLVMGWDGQRVRDGEWQRLDDLCKVVSTDLSYLLNPRLFSSHDLEGRTS